MIWLGGEHYVQRKVSLKYEKYINEVVPAMTEKFGYKNVMQLPKIEKTLLKVILFAFMENGYESLRKIEKLCKTDIRFMWLLIEIV